MIKTIRTGNAHGSNIESYYRPSLVSRPGDEANYRPIMHGYTVQLLHAQLHEVALPVFKL